MYDGHLWLPFFHYPLQFIHNNNNNNVTLLKKKNIFKICYHNIFSFVKSA